MTNALPAVGRVALADHVRSAIYDNLLTLAIAPGGRVNIDAVARQLNVSPTPVREALARLEAEELVVKRPMAGYVAAPLMSKAELADLLDLRLQVEPWLAELAAGADKAARATLLDLLPATDEPAAVRATRIHDRVAALAGNSSARQAVQRLNAQFHIHRFLGPHERTGTPADDHAALVRPIVAGKPAAARLAMTEHLGTTRARILAVRG